VESLLVEGGARVITSLLRGGVVDRLVVGIAPTIIGAGTEAVGDLRIGTVAEGIQLRNGRVCAAGDDVLTAFDVVAVEPRELVEHRLAAGEVDAV
jgi:riboflavin biosynthesis pyrimidine reductase